MDKNNVIRVKSPHNHGSLFYTTVSEYHRANSFMPNDNELCRQCISSKGCSILEDMVDLGKKRNIAVKVSACGSFKPVDTASSKIVFPDLTE